MSDVEEMISAHSARETTAQDESGSKKKEKLRREGGVDLARPRRRQTVLMVSATRGIFVVITALLEDKSNTTALGLRF
jgi:hypothetical protein